MEDLMFKVKDKDGNILEYEILLSFEDNGNNYIVYTDNTYNNDELNVYSSKYVIDNDEVILNDLVGDEFLLVNQKIIEFIG